MTDRYEVKFPVKSRDGKTYWSRCGVAFPSKDGNGFNILLDCVPVPVETGPIKLGMWPAEPKEKRREEPAGDLDDPIPF